MQEQRSKYFIDTHNIFNLIDKLKKENENPSVGVILCASKDEEVVEYAMSKSMSPTMVSKYSLKLIDKKLLEKKLKEITDIVEENKER